MFNFLFYLINVNQVAVYKYVNKLFTFSFVGEAGQDHTMPLKFIVLISLCITSTVNKYSS